MLDWPVVTIPITVTPDRSTAEYREASDTFACEPLRVLLGIRANLTPYADNPQVQSNSPLGFQIISPYRFREDELLAIAGQVQAALAAYRRA